MTIPFAIGQVVEFVVAHDVIGVIIAYTVRAGGNIMYEVSWFHAGEARSSWFDPAELNKHKGGKVKGF